MNNAPRRRTSTLLQESIELDNDLSFINQEDKDHEGVSYKHSKIRHHKFGYWGLIGLILLIVILFLVISIRNLPHFVRLDSKFKNEEYQDPDQVAIRLHPEDHESRDPQNLKYDWTVTSGWKAPDGVQKRVYMINGAFPGPTIEGRSGDTVEVTVHNALDHEGISLHWHGLHMRGSNNMDGAVGFTQSPIPAGASFVYHFQIGLEQHGTFWYHAHSHVQRGDGLYGGLVVHQEAPAQNKISYEQDMLLLVGDWFHRSAEEMLAWYTSTRGFGNEPVPDSLVINDYGNFNCSMAVPARPLDCSSVSERISKPILGNSKRTRLRVVNVGCVSIGLYHCSIAGISLQMEDADLVTTHLDAGFEIAPAIVNSVGILYPGERMDINLKWRETKVSAPSVKVILDLENFKYPNPALNTIQTFPALPRLRQGVDLASYKDSDQALEPRLESSFDIQMASALQPPTESIPHKAQHTLVVYTKTQKLSRFGNRPMGFINRTSWSPQSPPLIDVPRELWDDHQLVPFIPLTPGQEQSTWVDIVINNLDDGSHPFHLHGHDFWVLKTHRSDNGWGSYDLYTSEEKVYFDLDTAVRKDTVMVPRRGFAIIRFRANNKGIWMFHCHLLVHLKSGMAMGIQVGDLDT